MTNTQSDFKRNIKLAQKLVEQATEKLNAIQGLAYIISRIDTGGKVDAVAAKSIIELNESINELVGTKTHITKVLNTKR